MSEDSSQLPEASFLTAAYTDGQTWNTHTPLPAETLGFLKPNSTWERVHLFRDRPCVQTFWRRQELVMQTLRLNIQASCVILCLLYLYCVLICSDNGAYISCWLTTAFPVLNRGEVPWCPQLLAVSCGASQRCSNAKDDARMCQVAASENTVSLL